MAASSTAQPRMSHFKQAMLSFYWFATSMHWTAILITTLPRQALIIGGDAVKGQTLGTVLLIGAFVSMIVAPVFGGLSDRFPTRWGRRRPWIVLGTLMNIYSGPVKLDTKTGMAKVHSNHEKESDSQSLHA